VPRDVTAVNMGWRGTLGTVSSDVADPADRRPYHHGSLRSALIEASIALARDGGPGRVVLREAARAAGVSHAAAYRHFADRDALLAEVADHARKQLARAMLDRLGHVDNARARMGAVGAVYIDFALAEPGLFRTAFTSHPAADADADGGGDDPFSILSRVLDEAQTAGILDPRRREGAEIAAWSAVHGLAELLLDGPLPATPESVRTAQGHVLGLIERGLLTERE
jgi:AcrR family transcriptional regulator